MIIRKSSILCVIYLISINTLFSQTTGSDWINYFNNSLISIEYKEIDYQEPNTDINKKVLILKLKNLSSDKINISLQKELKYGNNCLNCDGNNSELNFSHTLQPNSFIEGSCNTNSDAKQTSLVIFKSFNSPSVAKKQTKELTDFRIKNIQVNIVN